MKNIYIILTILVLIVAGVGYSYYNFTKPISVTEIKDSRFSQFLNDKKETFKESTDWYEVKLDYPKGNQKVRDEIFEMWNNFAKENELKKYNNIEEAREGLQINVDGLKYSFYAEYTLAHSTSTITYVYEIYSFTGGAHGGTFIYPITFNEKLEKISAKDILPDEKLEKISKLAIAEVLKQKRIRLGEAMTPEEVKEMLADETWVKEGTNPKRDNYNSVWLDGNDLVINFGQYQVGSYAEGMYEVKIPVTEL